MIYTSSPIINEYITLTCSNNKAEHLLQHSDDSDKLDNAYLLVYVNASHTESHAERQQMIMQNVPERKTKIPPKHRLQIILS